MRFLVNRENGCRNNQEEWQLDVYKRQDDDDDDDDDDESKSIHN